ncbi:DUF4349 domain-containing protein [Chondromyces crocatus]|uniref:DUF4349 domain-containing protein n=1 Tax=Chondromyces crocatus TaxID=52 RepID=A0A0K1EB87_CHOCO|nr:DUF4349 domain-containing protein [Chondromyces crocatus]AKT37952.1 uncharacterized protein CMC5_020930 [Chondromyces crocatus]
MRIHPFLSALLGALVLAGCGSAYYAGEAASSPAPQDVSGYGANYGPSAPPAPPADDDARIENFIMEPGAVVSIASESSSHDREERQAEAPSGPAMGLAPPKSPQSTGGPRAVPNVSPQVKKEAPPPPSTSPSGTSPSSTPGAPDTSPTTASPTVTPTPGQQAPGEVAQPRRPMLVYVAGLWVLVENPTEAFTAIEAMTREFGGFLSVRTDASITVRIPVARYEEALDRVSRLGEIQRRDISVEDVTEAFLDLEIRLKNLRAIRARLELLLPKAKNVEEAVEIERELYRVVGEIERIEGKMKLLRDRAAFSTITVHVLARAQEKVQSKVTLPVPWLGALGLGRLLRL